MLEILEILEPSTSRYDYSILYPTYLQASESKVGKNSLLKQKTSKY